MNKIDWIFFDVGGVLIDDSSFEEARISLLLRTIKLIDSSTTRQNIIEMIPKANSMPGNLNENILNLFIHDKQKLYIARNFFAGRKHELIDATSLRSIRPEAKEVLEVLAKKYRLGLIANQPKATKSLLTEIGLSQYLSNFSVSDDHLYAKPDLRYFQEVLDECGTEADKSAMIDNNVERGIAPAKKMGMITVWYQLPDKSEIKNKNIDHKISNLLDLLKIF